MKINKIDKDEYGMAEVLQRHVSLTPCHQISRNCFHD